MYSSIISNSISSLLVSSFAINLNSISSFVFSLSVSIDHGILVLVQHGPSNPPHCCPSHKDACIFMMHVTDDQLKQPITFNR